MAGRGILVTFEGIDGSGKSTAAHGVAAALRGQGRSVVERAEPTRTWLGDSVRRGFREALNPWSEALLFMADHAQHVLAVERELAAGALVLCDRWSDSTFAYQGAVLSKPGPQRADGSSGSPFGGFDALTWLQDTEMAFDLKPDLTLLFDLDPALALHRVEQRGAILGRSEGQAGSADAAMAETFERRDLLERVRANYLRLAKDEPRRFVVLDAARAPDLVLADAVGAVVARLGR